MEGGEGVMAVIKGLPDGMAVVLMERVRQDLGARRRIAAKRRDAKPRGYELDVPTRLRKAVVSADAEAQACDGHYASTYQLAHCSLTPTSPPVDLPEFPLQRSEPCRTQGNFEVGGFGSEYRSRSPSPTSFDVPRWMSPDRGSLHSSRPPDRDTEAFVNSLRKYPTQPDAPPTADLLHRLIKQAQDKYIAKTQATKSMRNVREKTSPVSMHDEKPSKDPQTYTRRREESPARTISEVRHARRGHRSGFTSPAPGCSREIRARDTFDYLNSAIPRPPPGTASGDRRAVRETIQNSLRQVFGDAQGPVVAFPVCPRILDRYERHRREHHICEESEHPPVDEACGSLNSPLWGATCEPPEASTSNPLENKLVCCKCNQAFPCTCSPTQTFSCESRPSEDEIQERRRLEEIVCSWLDDLPVSAKEKPQDKFIRDALIKKLIDTLANIKNNEFDTKGREEIEQCIDKMPMWYPSDKREREKVRKNLIDSLFDRIKGFRKRDRFKDEIAKWLDKIDFTEVLDKDNVVNEFSKPLKVIALERPKNDGMYRDQLKCKIFDMLQALPIDASIDRDDLVNLKSEQLADQLLRLPRNVVKPDSYFRASSQFDQMKAFAKKIAEREFGGIILNALNEVDGLRNVNEDDKQVAIKDLISKLPNLLSDDEEYVAKEMYDVIHDWLKKLAADNGVNIDNETKKDFIDGLVDKLEDSLTTHLDLGESMTGFLSDLPKPDTKPSDQSYLDDEDSPSGQRSVSAKQSPSPQRYPAGKRRLSDQSNLDDNGSPTSQRSASGKKSSSPQRYPTGKRRPSDQSYLDDEGSPISQRSVSGKKSPSPQRYTTGKSRPFDKSYLDDEGSLTGQRSVNGRQSLSPQRYPTGKRRLSDQSSVDDDSSPTEGRSINAKRSPSPQRNPKGHLKGGSKVSDQKTNNEIAHPKDPRYLSDESQSGDPQNIDAVGFSGNQVQSKSDQQNNNKKVSPRTQAQLPGNAKVNQQSVNDNSLPNKQATLSDQSKERALNYGQQDGVKPHMREESKKTVNKIKDWLNHYREKAGFLRRTKPGNREEFGGKEPGRKDGLEFGKRIQRAPMQAMEPGSEDDLEFGERIQRPSMQVKEPGRRDGFSERSARGSWDSQLGKEPFARRKVSFSSDSNDDLLNLTTDDPKLKKGLKNNIRGILDQTNGSFGDDVESQLADLLADLVMHGVDEDSVRDQLLSILGPGVSSEEAEEIYKKLIGCANEMSSSLNPDATPNFMSKPSATSTPRKQLQSEKTPADIKEQNRNRRKAESDYKNDLVTKIKEWLSNHNILKKDADIDAVAQELANDFVDRQKYLQLNPDAKTSPSEELEHMKYQVYKRLNKLLDTEKINAVMPKVPILMNSINRIPVPQLAKVTGDDEFVQEELEEAISDWIKNTPLYKKQNEKQKVMLDKVAPDLADALTSALESFKTGKSNEDPDEVLVGEIVKHLKKSLPPRQVSLTSLQEMGNDLLKHLKGLELLPEGSNRSDLVPDTSPISQFNDAVMKWCNELPLPNTEQGNKLKKDIANKIMAKVGELNMNPLILNDDILYEDILSDFIDQQLNAIPGITNKEELKSGLMNEVNKLRHPLKQKMAGQAYKQQIRETVPKTLPSIENPTEADEASFEIMKDNLADAFINLNYVGGDTALKEKFKNKINDEIGKFANNYMAHHPKTPLSTSQLKKDLLSAMKKVDVPGDESMRSEVEQARMRDIIDDWAKELPLKTQTPAEQLQTNKVLKAMTQRLLDLEKGNELNPSNDYEEKLEKEIEKYVKKLPVNASANLDESSRKLAEKIRATEHSRTFTEGSRRSVEIELSPYSSGVGAEDRAHLQRIKERNGKSSSASGICRHCKSSVMQPSRSFEPCRKDAAVSPQPTDYGSQTDMATRHSHSPQCRCSSTEIPHPMPSPCPSRTLLRPLPCDSPRPRVSTGSQVHISPYIIVNEYAWEDEPNDQITDCPSQLSLHSIPQNRCGRRLGMTSSPPPDMAYGTSCRTKATKLGSFNCNEYNRGICTPPRRRHAVVRESLDCPPIPSRDSCHSPRRVWSRPHIYRDIDSPCVSIDSTKCGCRGQVPKFRRKTLVTCQTCLDDPMKLCPKCCGAPCPHPSNLYFR